MNWFHREPTLDEILSDSIVRALMEADGVDPQELTTKCAKILRVFETQKRFWA